MKRKPKKMDVEARAKEYELVVYWSEEDEAFLVESPALQGCMTHGDTEVEALANGRDAVVSWLEAAEEYKIPAPSSSKDYSGQFVVRLGKSLHRAPVHYFT